MFPGDEAMSSDSFYDLFYEFQTSIDRKKNMQFFISIFKEEVGLNWR